MRLEDDRHPAPNEGHDRETAGVILPPPFVYLGGLLPGLAGTVGLSAAVALGLLGLALVLIAARRFSEAGTAIPPYRPSTALVTRGLYRVSRNPIYLGFALIYLALMAGFASLGALVLLPAVLLVMEFGVIRREECYLERRFGQPYRDYRARVRRWF
jgi:protein-S-isoprenylcysteine O-methyltransferase Ste14